MLTQNNDKDFFSLKNSEQTDLLDKSLSLDSVNVFIELLKQTKLIYTNVKDNLESVFFEIKDNLKEVLTNIIVNIIAGIPDIAHMIKNSPKPYESTMKPDELENDDFQWISYVKMMILDVFRSLGSSRCEIRPA